MTAKQYGRQQQPLPPSLWLCSGTARAPKGDVTQENSVRACILSILSGCLVFLTAMTCKNKQRAADLMQWIVNSGFPAGQQTNDCGSCSVCGIVAEQWQGGPVC